MSTVLQKCIDITPNGVIRPWSLQDYRLIRVQPWWPKLRATTSWLRLWADWPTLQPQRAVRARRPAQRWLRQPARLRRADQARGRRRAERDRHAVPLSALGQRHRQARVQQRREPLLPAPGPRELRHVPALPERDRHAAGGHREGAGPAGREIPRVPPAARRPRPPQRLGGLRGLPLAALRRAGAEARHRRRVRGRQRAQRAAVAPARARRATSPPGRAASASPAASFPVPRRSPR